MIPWKNDKLDLAWRRFAAGAGDGLRRQWRSFVAAEAAWLDDVTLFVAIKEEQGGKSWVEWPRELAQRDGAALAAARQRLADRIQAHAFRQWLFERQWQELRGYCAERGVRLLGDLPIFVAHDSCDVWVRPDLFHLDGHGRPRFVAGVPPDYFSRTGQLWGNPLYDWRAMADEDYAWWVARIRACLRQTDLVRIDHFRGFEAYWEVPAAAPNAIPGRWVEGPGHAFFAALERQLGALPIVAEDLGVITEEVEALRDAFGLPGMKVLQFAWSGPKSPFQPHNYRSNCVVYTGTHDNDPTLAWWHGAADEGTREAVRQYVGAAGVDQPHWTLIRLAMQSVAHTCMIPMQDVLGLGPEGRMNRPGALGGNWSWRLEEWAFTHPARDHLAHLTWLYRRRPDQRTSLYEDMRAAQQTACRADDASGGLDLAT
jgi:4-alpha-glucanotransferase